MPKKDFSCARQAIESSSYENAQLAHDVLPSRAWTDSEHRFALKAALFQIGTGPEGFGPPPVLFGASRPSPG